MKRTIQHTFFGLMTACGLLAGTGCKKFVDPGAPTNSINAANIFGNDATAIGVLTGRLTNLSNGSDIAGGLTSGLCIATGLASDELTEFDMSTSLQGVNVMFYQNSYGPLTGMPNYWPQSLYPEIFSVNSAIEGLVGNNALTPAVQHQLLGEAYFLRAYYYFDLVNMYGDVPIVTQTNPQVNFKLPRSPKADVYKLIVSDLQAADSLLSDQFLGGNLVSTATDRVRPTKWAALTLLARVYLYQGDYTDAATCASLVINNGGLFSLVPLDKVFLMNSNETIWSLPPVWNTTQPSTYDGAYFILPPTGPNTNSTYITLPNAGQIVWPLYMNRGLYADFESGDQRRDHWTDTVHVTDAQGNYLATYPYAYKYKQGWLNYGSVVEYHIVMRLAELYLIRAEARAKNGDVPGAQSDINTIRTRAGLSNTTANSPDALVAAVAQERRVELFTEGHRWFDLQRTGAIDSVMSVVCPQKGGLWSSYKALFPIPNTEIQNDPNMTQTPGY